jgi:cation diffusion facilitator CzcD-associated flavoprotein CzcO
MSRTSTDSSLPVATIGAGPVGLAAAAHLLARGERPLVLEAGPAVASNVRAWDHVRLFSPWQYVVDPAWPRWPSQRPGRR